MVYVRKEPIVISVGCFQGRKPIGIDADRKKGIWNTIVILDAEPHWLDPRVVNRYTQDLFALFCAENGRGDSNLAISLRSGLWERIQINGRVRPVDERTRR